MKELFEKIVLKNSIRAYLDSFDEIDVRCNLVVLTDHPLFAISPVPHPEKYSEITVETGDGDQEITFKALALNVSPLAIAGLDYREDGLSFKCRFNQVITSVFVPYRSICYIDCEFATIKIAPDFETVYKGSAIIQETPSGSPKENLRPRPKSVRVK